MYMYWNGYYDQIKDDCSTTVIFDQIKPIAG